jgi:hypothetical protein
VAYIPFGTSPSIYAGETAQGRVLQENDNATAGALELTDAELARIDAAFPAASRAAICR